MGLGVVGGLARFARPEAWVLVPLLIVGAVWRARREPGRWGELAGVVAGLALVNVIGAAVTGVIAPQLFLLGVRRYEDAMGLGAAPVRPELVEVVSAVLSNVAGQVWFLIQPKNAWVVLPVAVIAVARRMRSGVRGKQEAQEGAPAGEAWLVAWAAAFVLATAGVWSTSDPYRFTIGPLALLAPVAVVEAVGWSRRPWQLAVVLGSLVLVMGHAAGREMRGRGPAPAPVVVAQEGVVATPDPWSYALITGRPAVLAEVGR